MFRRVPGCVLQPQTLTELAAAMIQPLEDGKIDKPLGQQDDDENTTLLTDVGLAGADKELLLPAGYTYFGQFVDHDITFDPVSSLNRQNDPNALVDFRTPRFDLDSVYGRGPADQPYLYEPDGLHLALGEPRDATDSPFAGPDLQRGVGDRALIGDPRNDENLIVSQLQVAFIKFHNKVADQVSAGNPTFSDADAFKLTQSTVRWHYQWVVIHDFLRRLVGDEVINDIMQPNGYFAARGTTSSVTRAKLLFYKFSDQPFMPIEFSVAAYRYGHSMARPSYFINDVAVADPKPDNAERIPLFVQDGEDRNNLNGFRKLPQQWGVQWKYFLPQTNDGPGDRDQFLPQPSYKIDHELGHPLGALPASTAQPEQLFAGIDPAVAQSLAARNLLRGRALGLPAGQDVARAMGIDPLSDDELYADLSLSGPVLDDLRSRAPLWFYVLREAEKRADSARLGPVGGRIVAEVLIGLLDGDPLSFLSVNPGWTPTLQGRLPGTFTLTDIVNAGLPYAPPPAPPYGG
jgi:hypothetical protein